MTGAIECGPYVCTAHEYHEDTEFVSHSALEVFRRSIPTYYLTYVLGIMDRPEPTPAMVLGSALHCLVLEPDRFAKDYCLSPECDRRTKEGKQVWQEFQAAAACKTILTKEQWQQAQAMAAAILIIHPQAQQLLSAPGQVEHSIRWQDPLTGIDLKARMDKYLSVAGIILDIKTATDPSPDAVARQAINLGYHRQADHYDRGRQAVYGVDGEFLFVVVGTQPPHDVAVYELPREAVALGNRQNNRLLEQLAQCRKSGIWQNEWSGHILQLNVPKWAYRQE